MKNIILHSFLLGIAVLFLAIAIISSDVFQITLWSFNMIFNALILFARLDYISNEQ